MMDIQSRVGVTIKSLNIDILGHTLQIGEKQTNKQTHKQTNKHTNKLQSELIYFFKSVPGLPWTVPGSSWKVPAMEGPKISRPWCPGAPLTLTLGGEGLGYPQADTLLFVHTRQLVTG